MRATAKKASKLSGAIKAANQQNRLGLILFVIPGFPDLTTYLAVKALLEQRAAVTIIETTLPVTDDFAMASATIIQAHHQAWQTAGGRITPDLVATQKPNFFVLYQQTLKAMGMPAFLQSYGAGLDGITPEWDDLHFAREYADLFDQADIECIAAIDSTMSLPAIEEALALSPPDGLIYLACSPVTAGQLLALSDIQTCAQTLKKLHPLATIAAGMGIKSADDIRWLAQIPEIDAVVVGTSFLQKTGQGVAAAESFLGELEAALNRYTDALQ